MKWDHTSETSDIKWMSPRNYAHRKQENENPSSTKVIIFSWHQNHFINQRIIWLCSVVTLLSLACYVYWRNMYKTIQLSFDQVSLRSGMNIQKRPKNNLHLLRVFFLCHESSGPDSRTLQCSEWGGCFESPWIRLNDITVLSRLKSNEAYWKSVQATVRL